MNRGFTYGLLTGFLVAAVLFAGLAGCYAWLTGLA